MLTLSFAPVVEREVAEAAALPLAVRLAPHRQRLVEEIQRYNPGARAAYLNEFEDEDLVDYREHLANASGRRGRDTRWIRTSVEPAFVGRVSAV